jgi:hypothetical protein
LAEDIRQRREGRGVTLVIAVLENEGKNDVFHMLVSFGHFG